MANETTTIQVRLETKAKLDKLKVHEREPYDEVVDRLAEKTLKEAGKQ